MSSQTILITASGGHIGTELVPLLLRDTVKLVLPTSNASRVKETFSLDGTQRDVAVEEGNMQDPLWVETILKKHHVDTVFLCLTGFNELLTTLNWFDAMQRAGIVKHLVYVSAGGDFVSPQGVLDTIKAHTAMHVCIKPIIELKLKHGGFPWTTTVLGPMLFWSNDSRVKSLILNEGIINEPFPDVGVSRVSEKDIATVACNTLTQPSKWAGKKIMIGSKERYTAADIGKLWSDALGKKIAVNTDDQAGRDRYERVSGDLVIKNGHFNESDGRAWARDLSLMFEGFAKLPFVLSDEDHELLVECLGRKPSDYEAWVRETAKSWMS